MGIAKRTMLVISVTLACGHGHSDRGTPFGVDASAGAASDASAGASGASPGVAPNAGAEPDAPSAGTTAASGAASPNLAPGSAATASSGGGGPDDGGGLSPLALDAEIAALLVGISPDRIASSIQTLVGFGTRNSCSGDTGGTQGIGAARDWIKAQFESVAGLKTTLHSFAIPACGSGAARENVIAALASTTRPDRLVVVGGHYDSRTVAVTDGTSPSPGANDSGSQTAVVLELARVLAPHAFDATLVFAAFAGEEQGLVGSAALVKDLGSLFPGSHVVAMLNCDIVGGDNTANDAAALTRFRLYSPGTPREVHTDGGTPDDTSPSRGLMRSVSAWGGAYVPALTPLLELREDRPGRGGDHESFIAAGDPGVRFIDPAENLDHEHTANDLFQYVTPSYTAQLARVVAAVAASLARAPDAPAGFVATGSTASATLAWSAPSAGPVDHYVVAARPVTENLYRRRVRVDGTGGSLRAVDLGISDASAFFVSVSAVDAAGHESLFAYPESRCDASGCGVQPVWLNVTAVN